MAYQAGYIGVVKVGSTDLNVLEWSLTLNNALLETTNTSTAGWETFIAGISGAEFEVKANWDAAAEPTSSPPAIAQGASLSMTLTTSTGKSFTFTGLVSSFKIEAAVKGIVNYSFSGKSSGAVTSPA